MARKWLRLFLGGTYFTKLGNIKDYKENGISNTNHQVLGQD